MDVGPGTESEPKVSLGLDSVGGRKGEREQTSVQLYVGFTLLLHMYINMKQ